MDLRLPPRKRLRGALWLVCLVLAAVSCGKQSEPSIPPPPPRLRILAVGDILLGRKIGMLMEQSQNFTLPFRSMAQELAAADVTFGNLEGPFCEKPPYPSAGLVFRVRPRAVAGLVAAGFDVLSVANNHFGDGGRACMQFTLEHLRAHSILPAGAGMSFEDAHAPAIVERHGVKFAFLAYTYADRNDSSESCGPVIAGRNLASVKRDVATALQKADVVLVSLHDGAEYTRVVARETREFCRAAIEAGATAVFGHHPHVPQRVENHGNGWIFYSLGNFVFQQNTPGTRTGLLARLTFSGPTLAQVEALPVVIEDHSQPRLANLQESQEILQAVGLSSTLLWTAPDAPPASR